MLRAATVTRASKLVVIWALFLALVLGAPAHAGEWVGSITVMWEWSESPNRVRIWAVDYAWTDDLYFTVLLEENPRRGDALDVSVTYYVPIVTGVYASLGHRVGLGWSGTSFSYLAVTFRFPGGGRQ